MRRKEVGELITGVTMVLIAFLTPFVAYVAGEMSLNAAAVVGAISAGTALKNWAASSPLFVKPTTHPKTPL